jgi:sterol desaturase/sphingolipid hydroxylase (fatty acid hydroxylase superfamily)
VTLVVVALLGAVVAGLALAERRRPLRPRVEPDLPHAARNLAVAALGGATTALAELALGWPILRRPSAFGKAGRRRGLLRVLPLPRGLRALLGFLLLDYTLWMWHRLNHAVPILWRFHLPHHVDRDLDATTGLRFHFGELALSAGFRAGQLAVLGVGRGAFLGYQVVLLAGVLFHHSNLRLPIGVERGLCRVFVTPRMHGIHHSIVEAEAGSNFGSLFPWWDDIHGTRRLDVPQAALTIGVPAYLDPREAGLERVLALPFERLGPSWQLPDGKRPARPALPGPGGALAP